MAEEQLVILFIWRGRSKDDEKKDFRIVFAYHSDTGIVSGYHVGFKPAQSDDEFPGQQLCKCHADAVLYQFRDIVGIKYLVLVKEVL